MKLKSWYPNLGGLRKQILKDFGAWSPASQMAMHTSLCVMIYIKTYSVIRCNCAICQIFTNDELRYTPVEGKALMGAITLTIEKRSQSVQSLRCAWLFVTPWTALRQASLCITNFWSLLKFVSIKLVIPSNHLILCHPLLPPSIFLSIRVVSNESVLCIRWPKYWSFSISPSNEYSGLISFRMDWLDLLAVQGTLTSLLQHHSSQASILRHLAFFMVQL